MGEAKKRGSFEERRKQAILKKEEILEEKGVDQKMKEIFLGEGQEPLTDKLIDELVAEKGFPIKDLERFKKQGFMYSRPRNSMISPMEFG